MLRPMLGTSSCVMHVAMNGGQTAYLKPYCKETHPHRLIREWVGLHLAAASGLVTPEAAIVNWSGSPGLSYPNSSRGIDKLGVRHGPQLVIKEIPLYPVSLKMVNDEFFDNLIDPLDADRIIVVDTLLINADRQGCASPEGPPETQWDNVQVTPDLNRPRVAGIDFSHCLPGSGPDGNVLSQELNEWVIHEGVYGLVPGLRDHRSKDGIQECLRKCAQWIDNQCVSRDVIDSIPKEWLFLDDDCGDVVLTFLQQRAQFLLGSDDGESFACKAAGALPPVEGKQ